MTEQYSQNPKLETIKNQNGLTVTIMDWGATIISIKVPVKGEETPREVLLGVKDPAEWNSQPCYFNATIGRFANRIAHSEFTIDGKEYKLNSGAEHCLHGGVNGFDKRRFTLVNKTENSLTYTVHSPDGDMGFPGNYDLTVTYTVSEDNALNVQYLGKCNATCWSCITNHAYFNLNGYNSSALNHTLWIDSKAFLPLDSTSIPTGEVKEVAGTAFDFNTPKTVGQDFLKDDLMKDALGYDHPIPHRRQPREAFSLVWSLMITRLRWKFTLTILQFSSTLPTTLRLAIMKSSLVMMARFMQIRALYALSLSSILIALTCHSLQMSTRW